MTAARPIRRFSATPASAPRRSASPQVTRSTTRGSPRSAAPSPTPGLATTAGRTAPGRAVDRPERPLRRGRAPAYPPSTRKPSWQRGIPALNGVTGRAYPDISMDASDGTSQASPTFAGILALATQLRHADLGTVNPALAAIGPRGTAAGIRRCPGRLHRQRIRRHRLPDRDRLRHRIGLGHHLRAGLRARPGQRRSTCSTDRASQVGRHARSWTALRANISASAWQGGQRPAPSRSPGPASSRAVPRTARRSWMASACTRRCRGSTG